jgi:hypothetical protein
MSIWLLLHPGLRLLLLLHLRRDDVCLVYGPLDDLLLFWG